MRFTPMHRKVIQTIKRHYCRLSKTKVILKCEEGHLDLSKLYYHHDYQTICKYLRRTRKEIMLKVQEFNLKMKYSLFCCLLLAL